MSQLNEHGKSFEEKNKRDYEQNFKIQACRNKLLGLWAAKKLGFDAVEADAYAKAVIKSDFDEPGNIDVLRKVLSELEGNGVDISENLVRKEMDSLLEEAREELR